MRNLNIVKVAQGDRIPLGKDVCDILGVSKGDFVAIYMTDRGEIALARPEVPKSGGKNQDAEA